MDTLKSESYKNIVYVALLVLVVCSNTFAQSNRSAQILIDSYKLPDKLTAEEAEKIITELQQAIALCTDDALKFRLEYREGMIYFKAGDLAKAIGCFKKITQSADCPDLIRLCSLNMTGQIYRMQSKDVMAASMFGELINRSQNLLPKDPYRANNAESVIKLAVNAGFARAEIYQHSQDYNSAISEYNRILTFVETNKKSEAKIYAPLALDKLSQLHLMVGRIEDYVQMTDDLIEAYPAYYRTGIIRLEVKTVKLLTENNASTEFIRGSFDAPARLIALIKDTKDKILIDSLAVLLKDLSNQYRQSYSGILLGYHYAWLLDISGNPQQAGEVFNDICKQALTENLNVPGTVPIIRTLSDYAQCQQSIILGEENKYKEALTSIHAIKSDPNNTHLSTLTDSIQNALETLKREVPRNVDGQ